MKTAQLLALNALLADLFDREKSYPNALLPVAFPVKFALAGYAVDFAPVFENFKARELEIFKKYGELSPDGKQYTVPATTQKSVNAELIALGEIESKVSFTPFAAADFAECGFDLPFTTRLIAQGFLARPANPAAEDKPQKKKR